MACRMFRNIRLRQDALDRIAQANEILADPEYHGMRLTLRQLYYQFVRRNWIENSEKSYKALSTIISNGRLAGHIDWDAIEDRGREPITPSQWSSLSSLVSGALRAYRLPRWKGQKYYAELWVEKQALAGVLEPLAYEYHVTLMVNKGYSSQSAMHESANRFIRNCDMDDTGECERKPKLFYLGDHDPSGEDMVRDIRDRMEMFGVCGIEVEKIALTTAQVRQYNPPPNPAKITDPRAAGYIAQHGRRSWEVDALPPTVLVQIIRNSFDRILNRGLMNEVIRREETHRERLREAVAEIDSDGDEDE